MAVYFITGKLGAGKSLVAVSKIKDYLWRGRPVATNLNINLNAMLGPWLRNTELYRLPDKPTSHDLDIIGIGNDSYDESKNGLIVLDECGTWFNSRTWNDKDRQNIINNLLHIRKKGWDVIFLIQDIGAVDKQARTMLGEMVGYCMRMDRIPIPFLTFAVKMFTGIRLTLPQGHMCTIRYGTLPTSPKIDLWIYRGVSLYSAYDTKQIFSDFYSDGTYSYLPAWYTHGRYMVPRDRSFYMRMTKIYLKRFSRFAAFAAGVVFTAAATALTLYDSGEKEIVPVQTYDDIVLAERFDGAFISSYSALPGSPPKHKLKLGEETYTNRDILDMNITLTSYGKCRLVLTYGNQHEEVTCNP
jgi:hypothetical protein